MKVIFFLLRGSSKQIVIASLLSICSAVLYILAIQAFNDILRSFASQSLNEFAVMVISIVLSSTLAILTNHYITRHFEFKISEQRIKMSELVLKSNFANIEKNKDTITPILFNDTIIVGVFAKTLPDFIVAFFTVMSVWGYMLFLSVEFTLIFIGVFSISILIILISQSYLFKEEEKAIVQRNLLYRRLSGLVNGLKELTLDYDHKKVYAKELIGRVSDKHASHNVNRNKVLVIVGKISESFVLISLGGIILISIYQYAFGKDFFIEFFTLVSFTLPSLIRIGLFFSSLKKAEASLDQINSLDVLLEKPHLKEASTKKIEKFSPKSSESSPVISLRGLQYEYPGEQGKNFRVGPFDLDIHKNEILIINGGNGSGKTTLIKLLTGLYDPTQGEISYLGNPIHKGNLEAYRNIFSAVFVDSFVFQDLRYIDHARVGELIERYLNLLEIQDKVTIDKGVRLSTTDLSYGQMSRLNLFRSLLEDKEYYIFDEWAANQDAYFKAKFYNEILPQLKADGKTIIAISHDEQYYHVADKRVSVTQRSLKLS